MKRVKRTAVIVIPKQPYIIWANSVDDGHVKFGDNPSPEHTIYLVEDITDYVVDTVEILKPHFEFIFKEELNNWHRLERDWPPKNCLKFRNDPLDTYIIHGYTIMEFEKQSQNKTVSPGDGYVVQNSHQG
jgi:hypothetical protein